MSEEFSNLPPKEREARLTAFILGELSSAEGDELRQQLAQDAELARELSRLQQTIELVRETSAMERKTSADGTLLRLDDQRREKLLAAFKASLPQTVASPAAAPRRPRDLRFLPLALAAALVGLLVVSVMLPSLARSKARAHRTSVWFAELNLPRGGAVEKSRASEFDRYAKDTTFTSDSARSELEKLVKRNGELTVVEDFSTLPFDTEGTKATPAPKVPAVALALPTIADMDGDARELKELAGEFDFAGRAMKPMTESLARGDVNRGLARGNEVAFGNNRSSFDDSAFRAPAPTTPAPAPQPMSNARWDNNDLASGGTIAVAPQTPAANLGTLWVETGVGRRTVVNEWQSSLTTPSAAPAGSVSVGEMMYANGTFLGRNTPASPTVGVPPPPPSEPTLTPQQAQSTIEARTKQVQNSPVPARPSILPTTTLGDDLHVLRANMEFADQQTAIRYAELAKEREIAGKSVSDLTVASGTIAQPALPDMALGGGGGGLGGRSSGGGVGRVTTAPANEGMLYAGVSIQPGLRPGSDGRNITDLSAVEQKVDGLKDAPIAQAAEPLSIRARFADPQPDVPAFAFEFESKSKAVEDRFGRTDDFAVTPEMIDAVKLQIQNAQSYAGAAGVASAKDNLSANRSSLATTPSASAPNVAISGLSRIVPAQTSALSASGLAANGVTINNYISEGSVDQIVSSGLSANAVVNYFADVPATAEDNTLAWKFSGNDSWFGGNTIQGFNMISVKRDTPGPLAAREEKMAGLKSDANGRVEIQLPAVADGGLRFRSKFLSDPSAGDKLEALVDLPQSRESEITREQSADGPAAGRYYFNLQSTNVSVSAGGSVVFNPYMGTNAVSAKGASPEMKELGMLQATRDNLERNIAAIETELKTPKLGAVSMVEVADAAALTKPSLWGRIAGVFDSDVERSARISVEQDMPDVDAGGRGYMPGYRPTPDPFFTQTELERIQSKAVLGKVVEKLKLDEAWGKKNTGTKLSEDEAVALLKKKLDVRKDSKTTLIDIRAKSESAEEAARLANAVAQAYADSRKERHQGLVSNGMAMLRQQLVEKDQKLAEQKKQLAAQLKDADLEKADVNRPRPSTNSPTPQPEVLTRDNAFSTFSLNVADVSFKLAAASLEKGAMPDVATVRSEEFINAFDYRDPMPAAGVPLAFVSERARYPFAHNRDVLRFSVKTAAQGRDGGKPLNIVLLLDNSGSMERADRVKIIQEALRALAAQLQPQDKLSVVTFSRTARLWADGVTGAQAAEVAGKIAALTPEGGTNLEEALDLAYRTALRHYAATAMNRVVLLTDGAANLGNVEPSTLKAKVESFRKQGVALDCFGIGWEGFNDDLLENLSRNGDGRYGFVNTPEEASTEFATQLAGALQVAASDVKVQVEFNPKRVTAYRQIGYAKHQLTKQQFRDNTVDAAEISASEAGNALYIIETNPRGEGPVATVRARFRVPQTSDYREHEWVVPFGSAVELEQSSSALRLATSASAFSEWLAGSPFAGEVTTDRLLGLLSGVPEVYGADPRPKKLEWMIRQAKSISGK